MNAFKQCKDNGFLMIAQKRLVISMERAVILSAYG